MMARVSTSPSPSPAVDEVAGPDESLRAQQALLDATFAAMRKSGVVWVAPAGHPARPTWLLWHTGSVVLARGGEEQDLPGLIDGGTAQVVVPSPSNRARQLAFTADVSLLTGQERAVVVPLLLDKRLNLPEPQQAAARWAAAGTEVFRLTPRLPLDA